MSVLELVILIGERLKYITGPYEIGIVNQLTKKRRTTMKNM